MSRYLITRTVVEYLVVDADSPEQAIEKHKSGESVFWWDELVSLEADLDDVQGDDSDSISS